MVQYIRSSKWYAHLVASGNLKIIFRRTDLSIYEYTYIHTIPYHTIPYHTIPLHYITLHYIHIYIYIYTCMYIYIEHLMTFWNRLSVGQSKCLENTIQTAPAWHSSSLSEEWGTSKNYRKKKKNILLRKVWKRIIHHRILDDFGIPYFPNNAFRHVTSSHQPPPCSGRQVSEEERWESLTLE